VKIARDEGAALVIALMAMLLMLALGTTLMLTTITETRIASSYGAGIEMFYAAEAAIDRVMADLRAIPDWRGLVSSTAVSTFIDGPPGGARTLADGTTVDLTEATSTVRVGESPPWRLFAWGALTGLLPAGTPGGSRAYVVVWVADAPAGQGAGSLVLLAHAYGPQGVLRALEVVVTPVENLDGSRDIRVLSWREEP
jgi:hypothetical protein